MASKPVDDSKPLRSKRECAERLSVSVRTIEKLIASGRLAAIKWDGCVRVDPDELDAFVERHRYEPRAAAAPAAVRRTPPKRRPSARPSGEQEVRLTREIVADLRARKNEQ